MAKKKESSNHVCQECLNSFDELDIVIVIKQSVFGEEMNHGILMCDQCAKTSGFEILSRYVTPKIKKNGRKA